MMVVSSALTALTAGIFFLAGSLKQSAREEGVPPEDADGRPLNLDFETGTFKDWIPRGEAFGAKPLPGEARSGHKGSWWAGSGKGGDAATGTLTSVPFKLTHRWCSYFVSGGSTKETRVEVVRAKDGVVLEKFSGLGSETLSPLAFDLTPELGEMIFIRLVDESGEPGGHLNFDHFRFHEIEPKTKNVRNLNAELAPDTFRHEGLSPEEAAKAMTLPEGFTVTLAAGEPEVQQPVAMAFDERGRLWIAENHAYPDWKPPEMGGPCRVVVFEDVNGDGKLDSRKLFIDKINFITGLEVGFGGVWIGAPPYLLFVPDKDADDKPDGPAEVLLDGWGREDTHETLCAFIWGPDGWLYGCQGAFVRSFVGRPGCPDTERIRVGAGVWRYHPQARRFELFSEGSSNPWGVDFDDRGQAFITTCVIAHLFHAIQGGRYQLQIGSHFNPHTYGYIRTMSDHYHWAGSGGLRASIGYSNAAGGGNAHCGAMIYLGDNFPEFYRGKLIFNNIHGGRVNMDILEPRGSGFVGRHGKDFLVANDRWSQIINLRYGPDGAAWIIDWYDKQQCHDVRPDIHDRTNGRIFKVAYGAPPGAKVDLRALGEKELVELVFHRNDWYVRHARKILQERGLSAAGRARLEEIASTHPDVTRVLRAMWALHAGGAYPEARALEALGHADPHVRSWAIQLALEDGKGAPELLAKLAELARRDPSPVVRLYVASAAQRLGLKERAPLVEGLAGHAEDAEDQNLPFMDWYALEPIVSADLRAGAAWIAKTKIPKLREFIARRVAQGGDAEIAALVEVLKDADPAAAGDVLRGLRDSLKGRRRVAMPEGWSRVKERFPGEEMVRHVSVTFGDPEALAALRAALAEPGAAPSDRENALAALLGAGDLDLPPVLLGLLGDRAVRRPVLRALGSFERSDIAPRVIEIYPGLDLEEKRDAIGALVLRKTTASALVEAIRAGRIPKADLTAAAVRQLRELGDVAIGDWINKEWSAVRTTPEAKLKEIAQWKEYLASQPRGDPSKGRAVFARTCLQCHTLYDVGGRVGPELTGANRADLDYLLMNIVDPTAVMGKDYQPLTVRTTNGRIVTGIVKAEDGASLTLQTENDTLVIPADEIDARRASEFSMMPEGLLAAMAKDDVRNLFAYLQTRSQVAYAPGDGPGALFNGKNLDGWEGKLSYWSVENGEIVGKGKLEKSSWLFHKGEFTDFRLIFEVKLVDDVGDTGVQFRSEPTAEGKARGPQADLAPKWWGKIYEEDGRKLIFPTKGHDFDGDGFARKNDWNLCEILAVGPRVRTAINGHPCAVLDDEVMSRKGRFALQLHRGPAMEVRFRNFQLEPLPSKFELKTVKPKE